MILIQTAVPPYNVSGNKGPKHSDHVCPGDSGTCFDIPEEIKYGKWNGIRLAKPGRINICRQQGLAQSQWGGEGRCLRNKSSQQGFRESGQGDFSKWCSLLAAVARYSCDAWCSQGLQIQVSRPSHPSRLSLPVSYRLRSIRGPLWLTISVPDNEIPHLNRPDDHWIHRWLLHRVRSDYASPWTSIAFVMDDLM